MAAAAAASTPQVGWLITITSGRLRQFAPDDEFLQIAARQRPGGNVAAGGAHVVILDHLFGEVAALPSSR